MPLESFTPQEAYANFKRNPKSRWPDSSRDDRLVGTAKVAGQPSFTLDPNEPIFTVGSCFARNIEKRLEQSGFHCVTRELSMSIEETGSKDFNGILNKYTSASMLTEFQLALETSAAITADDFLPAGDALWVDPQLPSTVPPAPLEAVRARRETITELYARVPQCRVVIITLGLIEAWYDRTSGRYLNGIPPRPAQLAEPDRFRLDVLTVAETVEALNRIHDLLSRHGHPDFRILVTVSPVPMNVTFTGRDVIAANTYSKSALRAAAEEFSRRERVDYFPSYEIVTLTNRAIAYARDDIHVNAGIIGEIMDSVVAAYTTTGQASPAAREAQAVERARIQDLIAAGDLPKAAKFLHPLAKDNGWKAAGFEEFEFRYQYGRAMVAYGKPDTGLAQLDRAVALDATSADAVLQRGIAKRRLSRGAEAVPDLKAALVLRPEDETALDELVGALGELGRRTEARGAIEAFLALRPGHAGATRLLDGLAA